MRRCCCASLRRSSILEASWTTFHGGDSRRTILYGRDGNPRRRGRSEILVYRDRGSETPSSVEKGDPLP